MLLTLLLLTAAPDACEKKGSADECHHPASDSAAEATSSEPLIVRGDKLKGLPKAELASLLKSPADFEGKSVSVEATVRRACERKGCWMELAPTAAAKGPGVRV